MRNLRNWKDSKGKPLINLIKLWLIDRTCWNHSISQPFSFFFWLFNWRTLPENIWYSPLFQLSSAFETIGTKRLTDYTWSSYNWHRFSSNIKIWKKTKIKIYCTRAFSKVCDWSKETMPPNKHKYLRSRWSLYQFIATRAPLIVFLFTLRFRFLDLIRSFDRSACFITSA